jgi:hypothetical protein
MTVDLVVQGGGANGLFQAHLWAELERRGYKIRKAIGTSVGAIMVAALRVMSAGQYIAMFEQLRTRDVMRKPAKWLDWTAYIGLRKHTGLYDWTPLRELLAKHLPSSEQPQTWVTRVNSATRQVDSPLACAGTVFESALMPIIGRFSAFYDGGPREQVPLSQGLQHGIGSDETKVVILLTSPFREVPAQDPQPRNGLDSIMSVLDATLREGKKDDLTPFLLLNWLASQLGPLPRPGVPPYGGGQYVYYPTEIWAPLRDLGPAMDFDSPQWKDVRRQEAGLSLERGPLVDAW